MKKTDRLPITPFKTILERKLDGMKGWRDPANQVVHKPTQQVTEKQATKQESERALARTEIPLYSSTLHDHDH